MVQECVRVVEGLVAAVASELGLVVSLAVVSCYMRGEEDAAIVREPGMWRDAYACVAVRT